MNVYDFDETILDGDTEDLFFEYALKELRISPLYRMIYKIYKRKEIKNPGIKREETRPKMYMILRSIDNIDEVVEKFWDLHENRIKPFYKEKQKEDDVISSATPRFLVEPIVKRLGVKTLIATDMDKRNGKLNGPYNKYSVKVSTFKDIFPDAIIDEFYSDSLSDTPMALIAKKAFRVTGQKIEEWNLRGTSH